MSSTTADAVRIETEIEKNRMDALVAGTSTATQLSAKKVVMTDSTSTTAALAGFVGTSSLSGTADLTLTLAAGAIASFTAVGFARVTVTDSGGNITDGSYYIPFGTLA